jgi:Flp pilus assembly protein TadG
VEVTLMAPLLVLLLLFVVACGRLVQARLRLDDAAHQGARAASLARDPATATTAATATVRAALAPGGATCADVGVAVDVGAFRPGGAVTVTVTCHVAVADLTGLHLPGTAGTETASFTSPVDQFRGVTSAGTP